MLSINKIFFVFSVDVSIDKRQNDIVQKLKVDAKVLKKMVKVAKRAQQMKENKDNRRSKRSQQIRFVPLIARSNSDSEIFIDEFSFATSFFDENSNDPNDNLIFDEIQPKRQKSKKSLPIVLNLRKKSNHFNNEHQKSSSFLKVAFSPAIASRSSSFVDRSRQHDFNSEASNTLPLTRDRFFKQIKKLIYSTRSSTRLASSKN